MADLEDIIMQAVDAAEAGEDLPPAESNDTTEPEDTEDPSTPETEEREDTSATETETEEEEAEPSEESAGKEAAVPAKEKDTPAASEEDKELDAILKDMGISAPAKGQRENKIPYARVRKIGVNAIKRARAAVQKDLETRDTELATHRSRLADFERADQLIANDPDRYMQALALMHPDKYGRFMKGGAVETKGTTATTVPDEKDDPKPGPDVKYDDGSFGYSPEQFEKREQWLLRQATRQAEANVRADYEKRFGPIEKEWKSGREQTDRLARIQAEVKQLREVWGDDFTADEEAAKTGKSEIMAYMTSHPGSTLTQATTVVLSKKIRDRATAAEQRGRDNALKELKDRPAAAKGKPAGSKRVVTSSEPRDLEDVINEAINQSGLDR